MTTATRNAEGLAWERIHRAAPRGAYEHLGAYQRRTGKQKAFLARVERSDGGCWLWTGQVLAGNGRSYPMFYHARHLSPTGNTTRSSFMWMMREFFPEVEVRTYEHTVPRCGHDLCISPYHRARKVTEDRVGKQPRMSHALVLEIYACRHSSTVKATAELYGLHPSAVSKIWNGDRWSTVTRHVKSDEPKAPRPDEEVVLAIYALRGTDRTRQSVADEFGVAPSTVFNIWNGKTRADLTSKAGDLVPKPRTGPGYAVGFDTMQKILKLKGVKGKREVAAMFGCGPTTVLRIWNGQR